MDQCSKPPLPCIACPNPVSASPTPFTYERRHFNVKTIPADFPYQVVHNGGLSTTTANHDRLDFRH